MSGLGLFRLHPGFRGSSSSSDDESPSQPPQSNPNRVKRALFGPTDHEENLRFVRKEMKKAKNEAASKWNFDFDSGTPMKGRFSWEEAKPSEIHSVYNLDRLPYLATHTESETKENRVSISPEESTSQLPDPLAEPSGSIDDLRTPQQGTSAASSSSTVSSEQPPPSELGARPKENAKEKKLTGTHHLHELSHIMCFIWADKKRSTKVAYLVIHWHHISLDCLAWETFSNMILKN